LVACRLAPTLSTLVTGRLAQGTAAAVKRPASMALIGQAFPRPRERLCAAHYSSAPDPLSA
jgi:DHA2 family methylenomycin A resistance protein-like MFS transporter